MNIRYPLYEGVYRILTKQTGLTHLHVYTLVIYRTERETVACIIITACRSPRKDTEQQFSRFSVNKELK